MLPAFLVTLEIETLVLRLCERPAGAHTRPVVVLFLIPRRPVLGTLSDVFKLGVDINRSLPLSAPTTAALVYTLLLHVYLGGPGREQPWLSG